jgi:fluoride ion exporter CrcB/FEX
MIMRRYIILASLMGLVSLGTLQAQISDKLMPHFGFMYEYNTASYIRTDGTRQQDFLRNYYVLNVGAYYLLAQKNDIFSVGVEPNLQLGISPVFISDRLRLGYVVQTPVYAMARVGAGSTPYNQQRVGLGVGIGGSFTTFSYFRPISQRIVNERGNFIAPGAVVEVTINSRGNPLILRAHASLAQSDLNISRYDENGDLLPPPPQSNFEPFDQAGYVGFGIVYTFSL